MSSFKLGLGTVQFGMDYGVSNRQGITTPREAEAIISTAAEQGIRVIDTAHLYGESEEVLGRVLRAGHGFDIVTKLPPLLSAHSGSRFAAPAADRLLEQSLSRLRQSAVYGLLLHRAADLLSPHGDAVMEWLLSCKTRGLVHKVGVSVYAEDDIGGLTGRYPITLIQAPINLLDQRLIHNGALKICKARGIEVHARSVFLQGLLLMDPGDTPVYFRAYDGELAAYRQFLRREELAPVEAALSFVNEIAEVDAVICGVNDRKQLLQLAAGLRRDRRRIDYAPCAASDPGLLNPSLWHL